ncbi:MAG: response regulator [Polyangiaceae bacterium]
MSELDAARRAAESANLTMERFVHRLSHELRDPLTPIVASLTLIRRTVAPSSFLDRHLDTVERQVASLTRIVDGMVQGPRRGAPSPAARPSQSGERPIVDDRPARRVLVVDDNQDAAESFAELVESFGYETRVALDGPSALAECEAWKPELVFLDIGLPGMSGYDVARELRRRDVRRPVLVALTGYGQESDRRKSREAGFALHLLKPPKVDALESVLAALEGSPAPHPSRAARLTADRG